MFGSVLISIITLLHVYVFWRAASVPFFKIHVPMRIFLGAGLLLLIIFVSGRVIGHDKTGFAARVLEFIGMNWMAVLFLIAVPLISVDILTGFGFFFPDTAPSLRGMAIIAGCLLSIVALFQGLRPPVIQDYEVRIKNLPAEIDGKVLVAVSDLHLGSLIGKRWLEARVDQIQKQSPDLVVLLGDIFEGHGRSPADLIPILASIKAPLGKWAVTGNHEFHRDPRENMDVLKDAGFQVLHDRWIEARPGFVLAGVDDLTARYRAGLGGDPIPTTLRGRPPGATVFFSHTPWEAGKADDYGADLMISGHTHGGQIWPFGYLVRLTYPMMGGRYEVGGMTVIVSRGAGTWGPRMRLWRPGEIVRVILRK